MPLPHDVMPVVAMLSKDLVFRGPVIIAERPDGQPVVGPDIPRAG